MSSRHQGDDPSQHDKPRVAKYEDPYHKADPKFRDAMLVLVNSSHAWTGVLEASDAEELEEIVRVLDAVAIVVKVFGFEKLHGAPEKGAFNDKG